MHRKSLLRGFPRVAILGHLIPFITLVEIHQVLFPPSGSSRPRPTPCCCVLRVPCSGLRESRVPPRQVFVSQGPGHRMIKWQPAAVTRPRVIQRHTRIGQRVLTKLRQDVTDLPSRPNRVRQSSLQILFGPGKFSAAFVVRTPRSAAKLVFPGSSLQHPK